MPRWRTEARRRTAIGPVALAALVAALPGLPLAGLAAWRAAPEAGALRAGGIALATLPVLVLAAAWACRRVPPAAPRIAASCGATPLAVLLRVWVPLTWRRGAVGVAGAVLVAVALAWAIPPQPPAMRTGAAFTAAWPLRPPSVNRPG